MLIEVDFNSEEAIYIQLCNQIIMGIATSVIQEGDSLPSVRQLADRIGVLAGGRLVLEADTPALRRRFPGRLEEGLIEAMEGRDAE